MIKKTTKKRRTKKKQIQNDSDTQIQIDSKFENLETKFKTFIYLVTCAFFALLYHMNSVGKQDYVYYYGTVYCVVPALIGAYLLLTLDYEYNNPYYPKDTIDKIGGVFSRFIFATIWFTWPIVELFRYIISLLI